MDENTLRRDFCIKTRSLAAWSVGAHLAVLKAHANRLYAGGPVAIRAGMADVFTTAEALRDHPSASESERTEAARVAQLAAKFCDEIVSAEEKLGRLMLEHGFEDLSIDEELDVLERRMDTIDPRWGCTETISARGLRHRFLRARELATRAGLPDVATACEENAIQLAQGVEWREMVDRAVRCIAAAGDLAQRTVGVASIIEVQGARRVVRKKAADAERHLDDARHLLWCRLVSDHNGPLVQQARALYERESARLRGDIARCRAAAAARRGAA